MQTRPPITTLAGRYALEEELGRTATGIAWRARDLILGRTVSLKVVHPRLADDPVFARRLAEEASRVAALSAPGVARLLDSGLEEGLPFLVREYVDGSSARARLRADGPMPSERSVRIAVAVLRALAPVHEAGVLHLNLRLDDVLVIEGDEVRITGLALGPAVSATLPAAEAARLLGREGVAPEQADGGAVDERTDVFAVGAMLFELLTGEPPRGRRSPRQVRPSVPRTIDLAVARALAPEPGDRFDGVGSFASALGATGDAASLGTDSAGPTAEQDAAGRAGLSAWLGAPVAIAVVAALVIVAGLWLDRLEVGGPLGIRPVGDPPSPSASPSPTRVRPVSVAVFDPFGDESENGSTASLTLDGDPATAWRSENYFDGSLNKEGVGLVFDLGAPRNVVEFRLSTPNPGYLFQIAVGDDPEALLAGIGEPFTADLETGGALAGTGRYVLVWITTVVAVSDGNRAEVAEFRVVVGPDA